MSLCYLLIKATYWGIKKQPLITTMQYLIFLENDHELIILAFNETLNFTLSIMKMCPIISDQKLIGLRQQKKVKSQKIYTKTLL